MIVTDRRRFYINDRGGAVWDDLDVVEKAKIVLYEAEMSERMTKVINGIKDNLRRKRNERP